MTARVVWVIEVDGKPFETWLTKDRAVAALPAYATARGIARLVRYAPSSKTERNRTKQHARAAKKRSGR